jgi:hypothetical protein
VVGCTDQGEPHQSKDVILPVPESLTTAAVMYAEQAARILDQHGQDLSPEELAAAWDRAGTGARLRVSPSLWTGSPTEWSRMEVVTRNNPTQLLTPGEDAGPVV